MTTQWRLPLELRHVGTQQLEELRGGCGLGNCQAGRVSCRWWFHDCAWTTLLCRQRLPFGPVFQDHTHRRHFYHFLMCPNCPQTSVLEQYDPCGEDSISARVSVRLLTLVLVGYKSRMEPEA